MPVGVRYFPDDALPCLALLTCSILSSATYLNSRREIFREAFCQFCISDYEGTLHGKPYNVTPAAQADRSFDRIKHVDHYN